MTFSTHKCLPASWGGRKQTEITFVDRFNLVSTENLICRCNGIETSFSRAVQQVRRKKWNEKWRKNCKAMDEKMSFDVCDPREGKMYSNGQLGWHCFGGSINCSLTLKDKVQVTSLERKLLHQVSSKRNIWRRNVTRYGLSRNCIRVNDRCLPKYICIYIGKYCPCCIWPRKTLPFYWREKGEQNQQTSLVQLSIVDVNKTYTRWVSWLRSSPWLPLGNVTAIKV